MSKRAVSLTLDEDNLLWLKGLTTAAGRTSLSQTVDEIVSTARRTGQTPPRAVRSVVGSVEISDDDPDLSHADEYIRSWVSESIARPLVLRERPPRSSGARRKRLRHG